MATTTATRRLTAILAADVVGYSRLMGADEEGTHERFKAHLRELIDPKIREHHGRIVKTAGDGVLAEFASVVDAVRCAGEIQRAMVDRDLDLAEKRRLRFRIGVNLGDVIADDDDIYGDGVNIAVRLEGLAAPGSICVSGTVRDHIGDRLPYAFEDLGEQSVKNIARPVRAYALRPEGTSRLPVANVASPRYAFAHIVKGQALRAQKRWEEATPEYEAALALNRNSVYALACLGPCKLYAGSIEEVIPLAEQAIRLSPRDPSIGWFCYMIGTVHLLQSHTDEAIV